MAQTISTAYASALQTSIRSARGYVVINGATTISDDTYLASYKIQTQLQNDKKIFGSSVAKFATIEIINPGNSTYAIGAGSQIEIFYGLTLDIGLPSESVEYISQGSYTIMDVKYEIEKQKIILEAYDAMVKFNVKYVEAGTYPMTLANFISYLCGKVSITLGSTTFGNSTIIITEQPNVADNEVTIRDILSWAAELAGGNAIIARDNKLYIRNYGAVSAYTIDATQTIEFKPDGVYGPITGVAMVREALNDAVYYPDPLPEGVAFRIIDNMVNYNARETIVDDIYNIVNGLTYRPFNLKWRGSGHLDFMDKITITDKDSNSYETYVMNSVFEFNGSSRDELSALAYTPSATNIKNPGSAQSKIKYTEARVDKVEGTITLMSSEIDDLESSVAQLVIDTQTITSTVENTVADLGTLSTQVQQTASSLTTTISDLNNVKSYYQITADGLQIGKSSTPAQIKIGIVDNLATMTLTDGSANTATIQSDTMKINNVKVVNTLTVGNHIVQKLTGSTTRTIWLPLG